MITTRGTALPPWRVRWTNRAAATLDTLTLDAAHDIFVAAAEEPTQPAEKTALLELLHAVDCMPIAVVLISQLAQQGHQPSLLLKRWNRTYSKLLASAGTGREHNVEVSITLSLKFLPPVDKDAGPFHLLSVCSELADGLREPVFEQLREFF